MILHPIVYVCTSAIKCRMAFPIHPQRGPWPGAPHATTSVVTQEAHNPNCSTPMQKVVVAVPQVLKVFSRVFSWEPTIWTLMSGGDEEVKKTIDILTYKQWLLSIDMKTKVVQHVPKIIFNVVKLWNSWFPAPVWLSDIFSPLFQGTKYMGPILDRWMDGCLTISLSM